MNRDTLGMLFLKMKNRLKLRLICLKYNKWIMEYNKYWFVQYFNKNQFLILKKANKIKHIKNTQIRLPEGKTIEMTFLECLTHKTGSEINIEMKRHPLYETWLQEAKNLHFINTIYEEVYCRIQYLQGEEIVCSNPSHYSVLCIDFSMRNINILSEDLLEFYDTKENYFMELNESSDRN